MKKTLLLLLLSITIVACDDIVEVEDISGANIVVLAPTNGSVLTISTINFSWEMVEDAEEYKLQIASPTFENANQIVLDTTIATTNFTTTLETGNYQWRIRAENSEYHTNYSTQSFTID